VPFTLNNNNWVIVQISNPKLHQSVTELNKLIPSRGACLDSEANIILHTRNLSDFGLQSQQVSPQKFTHPIGHLKRALVIKLPRIGYTTAKVNNSHDVPDIADES
jgi:hypothetical protein